MSKEFSLCFVLAVCILFKYDKCGICCVRPVFPTCLMSLLCSLCPSVHYMLLYPVAHCMWSFSAREPRAQSALPLCCIHHVHHNHLQPQGRVLQELRKESHISIQQHLKLQPVGQKILSISCWNVTFKCSFLLCVILIR